MTNKMFLNSHCWKELRTKLFLLHARKNLLVIVKDEKSSTHQHLGGSGVELSHFQNLIKKGETDNVS